MTTVKLKFRPSTVADRPGSIVILVTRHRIVRRITTGYKVFPHEWDETHAMPVTVAGNGRVDIVRSITQRLLRDISRLYEIIENLDRRCHCYTSDDVVAEFQCSGKENTFFIFMENVIIRLRQLNQTGTVNNYCAALNSFRRFRDNGDITLDAIDHIIIEDYQVYLKSCGLTPNSISFYMRILRAVYNRAVEQELVKDRKPFRTVFTGTEKTLKRAISIRDIKRIRELDLSSRPNLEFARDIFLFLFFCRGMSFIDAAFLKKTDIHNGVLTYRRHKTGQLLHIKIVSQIRELIERYSSGKRTYLLTIMPDSDGDERKQYNAALRRINNALKNIADMIKLPIPLTTYVSRHSWATIAKSKNVPVSIISDALGHDSISTTQIYLASIDPATIDSVNKMIIKDLYDL